MTTQEVRPTTPDRDTAPAGAGLRRILVIVSSPPPEHNFEGTPVFEAGPYEYGVPNAPAHGRITPSGEHA